VQQLLAALTVQREATARKAVEAAKLTARNTDLNEALSAARNTVAAVTAERDKIADHMDALNAELTTARNEINALNEEALRGDRTTSTERAEHARTVERFEAENAALQADLNAERKTFNDRLNEGIRQGTAKLTEKLNQARAEASTVDINRYRKAAAGKAATAAPNRPAMSDEEAVQAMYEEHNDPDFTWSQNAVRKLTGAGWGRIPGLVNAWHEKALNEGDGDVAVNQ
jgi:chromosome segregation ATPase